MVATFQGRTVAMRASVIAAQLVTAYAVSALGLTGTVLMLALVVAEVFAVVTSGQARVTRYLE